ncbi:MAG: hypothetical protein ABR576_12550 [Thermoanaerobaculia bacterium]
MSKKSIAMGLIAALVGAGVGCTNDEGETESPVTLTVNLPQQPLGFNPCAPLPLAVTIETIELESRLKNPSQTDPTGFATVQIANYRVEFRRLDGGTRVPPTQNFSAAVTVEAGGTATLNGFPIMTAAAMTGTPFDQLLPFNGGIDRETGRNLIQIQYLLTFFGTTVSGHRVQSETAAGDLIVSCAQ